MDYLIGHSVSDRASFEYIDPSLPTRWEEDFYKRNVRNFGKIHFDYLLPPQVENEFDFYRLFIGQEIYQADIA